MVSSGEVMWVEIENPFETESAEGQLYTQIARVQSPLTAAALAARVDCERPVVEHYLRLFADLGLVLKRTGQPPVYERNDAYFARSEPTALAVECSLEKLETRMYELIDEIWVYQKRYGADAPMAADNSAAEITGAELADWEDACAELRCYEQARRIQVNNPPVEEAESAAEF